MSRAALAFAALLAGCAAQPPQSPGGERFPLRNAGFESAPREGQRCPEGWGCTMHGNPDAFRFVLEGSAPAEGTRALCIERVLPEPWAVASQSVPAPSLRGRRVRFSIALRGEGLTGKGAGPWVLVNGVSGLLLHEERVEKAAPRWERRAIEFQVPPQAEFVEVGATLLGGGRVCIDDARLEPV